jgi:thiol-disulfide isomerase/thioredoxin
MKRRLFLSSRRLLLFIVMAPLAAVWTWSSASAQAGVQIPKPVAPLRSPPPQQVAPPPQSPQQVAPVAAQPFRLMGHPTQGVALRNQSPNSDPNDQPGPKISNSLVLRKYDEALFREAQNSGRPIIVVFSKSDCPGCTLQVPSLQRVLKDEEFKSIEVFQVDFINQREIAQRFNTQAWTAIIGFKGAEYRLRMQGLNRPSDLRRELRKLLQ